MEKPFTMPKLGATMTEGTVLRWLYESGAWVEKGEPIVEIMTDKVNIEVETPISGRLVKVLANDGDVLQVGMPMAILSDDADDASSTHETATNEIALLRHTTSIASTPAAKREAALYRINLRAVVSGGARPPLNRNDVLAFLAQANQQREESAQLDVRATPIARKIAREHQVDLAQVAEHRPGEKVTRADVESHLHAATPSMPILAQMLSPAPSVVLQAAQEEVEEVRKGGGAGEEDEKLVPLTPVRHIIGQRMLQSVTSAPHIYLDLEIDMTEAERCRQSIGRALQTEEEPAPSLTALIVRAVAAAIVLHPSVNAVFAPGALQGKDAIRQRRAAHIGIAVDTERALVTPVIRNAHQLSLPGIARELRRLTLAARQESLIPDEVTGATFTVSNLGMYAIDTFHAIIVPGQSAILAVGKVTKRSVVIEDGAADHVEIRPVMKVSLSADHRVLDGASGSRFLHQFKIFMEEPYLLL